MSASCGAALVLRDITIASKSRVQVRSQELQFSAVVLPCVTLAHASLLQPTCVESTHDTIVCG